MRFSGSNGKIVIATVKGDVHDIGKNIVGVVLGCNNYEVIDLGVMTPFQQILDAAKNENADVIGLSGLITPSLDEMTTVAREMSRQGFDIPLLIGGAATSPAHTAVKISPEYEQGVIHVRDASRSVTTMNALVGKDTSREFIAETKERYDKVRADRASRDAQTRLLSLDDARLRQLNFDWKSTVAPPPTFTGLKVLEGYPLTELKEYISWTPFFGAWELRGAYPAILQSPTYGEEAQSLFSDAQSLLQEMMDRNVLDARAVIGFFPANSVGDDVELYADDRRNEIVATFHFLRQQWDKSRQRANLPLEDFCLADFIAPKDSGIADYIGAFVVTAGIGSEEYAAYLEAKNDDYNAIMSRALADRLAEAFSERLHERVRKEFWALHTAGEPRQLKSAERKNIRVSDRLSDILHVRTTQRTKTLWKLLDAENLIGTQLTENYAILPTASTAGLYFSHPGSRYFGVGRIGLDQVEDYALRKRMSVSDISRWLSPNIVH